MEVKINKFWWNVNFWGSTLLVNAGFAAMGITLFSTILWWILWAVLIWGNVLPTLADWVAKEEVKDSVEVKNG